MKIFAIIFMSFAFAWMIFTVIAAWNIFRVWKITNDLKKKELELTVTKLQAPPPPKPVTGYTDFISYKDMIAALDNFLKTQFQRLYTNLVLPKLRDSTGKISRLAPDDKTYKEMIITIVLQTLEIMPPYLRKNVCKYFEVSNFNADEKELRPLIEYMSSKVKGLLDYHILNLAEEIEKNGAGTYEAITDAFKINGKTILNGVDIGKMNQIDGTPVQVM